MSIFSHSIHPVFRNLMHISISPGVPHPLRKFVHNFSTAIFPVCDISPSVPATKKEYLEKLLYQQPRTPPNGHVLKVAVLGRPNAGKSSLVNMLVQWHVCAVAGKAHTTRSKQLAALMKDNVQVVFVDLPGLVPSSRRWNFKLERAFIRDPHAAIFDSDLILIVVDVTNQRSARELDPELIKALHYFEGKESVLVLNKIDQLKNDPTRLLEITRRLTTGVVGGRRSHLDAYENRFRKRAELPPDHPRIRPPTELIAEHLPAVCHEEANKLLAHLARLRQMLELQSTVPDNILSDPRVHATSPTLPDLTLSKTAPPHEDRTSLDPGSTTPSGRLITETDVQSIDEFFSEYTPELPDDVSETDAVPSVTQDPPQSVTIGEGEKQISDVYYDSLLETLKEQLMLKTATPEEVEARRKRWLEVSVAVKGITNWPRFSEVFMVSSATGDGIDKLRDYLISRARPNRLWIVSPLLVTEHEPGELVRMCVWAHCLQHLQKEVPYSLRIVVDDCERARLPDADDRLFVHAKILCRTERHLRQVIGTRGTTIQELAGAVKLDLMNMFRSEVVVKLTAQMENVHPHVMHRLRRAKDFAEVFPERNASNG